DKKTMSHGTDSRIPPQAELGSSQVKGERIRTDAGFQLLLDPGDFLAKLLVRDGVFEAPETDLVTRLVRPGDTCVDAGCHLGYYTCLLAGLIGSKGRLLAFDANPASCAATRRNLTLNGLEDVEVVQAALGDRNGSVTFHVATDDQTGLSSLGPIELCKKTITVPMVTLESFLKERRVRHLRLLKLDVEGAEELVLKGLGRFLARGRVDFILVECFDERLQLLGSSVDKVTRLLHQAGYLCWEYGTENPAGWSLTSHVRSRGDCNYLFASPSVEVPLPPVSLSRALAATQQQRDQLKARSTELESRLEEEKKRLEGEKRRLEGEKKHLERQLAGLQQDLHKAQDDIDWLMEATRQHEEVRTRLEGEKQALAQLWQAVESSAGWRLLNTWRRLRNRLAPIGSLRRKLYDAVLNRARGLRP
ncbi:MAG: FkbM family methyltransferase, partial [Terriglobia bacterium]